MDNRMKLVRDDFQLEVYDEQKLVDFVQRFIDLAKKYKDHPDAMVRGDCWFEMFVEYERPETDEECAKRIVRSERSKKAAQKRAQTEREKALETIENLKQKFGIQ